MRAPDPHRLTGKWRFRTESDGRLVLQVQESGLYNHLWRDAKITDIDMTDAGGTIKVMQ